MTSRNKLMRKKRHKKSYPAKQQQMKRNLSNRTPCYMIMAKQL